MELGSSVSVVSGYVLNDRTNQVRFPAETKDLSSNFCVQTGCGAHPASCPVGTGSPFPRGKARPWPEADHSPPSSAEVVNEYELHLLLPLIGLLWDCYISNNIDCPSLSEHPVMKVAGGVPRAESLNKTDKWQGKGDERKRGKKLTVEGTS
jgi:hypothetical protein